MQFVNLNTIVSNKLTSTKNTLTEYQTKKKSKKNTLTRRIK